MHSTSKGKKRGFTSMDKEVSFHGKMRNKQYFLSPQNGDLSCGVQKAFHKL